MKKGTRIKKQYRVTWLNKEIEMIKREVWKVENGKYENIGTKDIRYREICAYLKGLETAKMKLMIILWLFSKYQSGC